MISSAAVILNGLLAHYGEVNARIRAMDRERFDLAHLLRGGTADEHLVNERLAEINHQIPDLLERHWIIHDAMLPLLQGHGLSRIMRCLHPGAHLDHPDLVTFAKHPGIQIVG